MTLGFVAFELDLMSTVLHQLVPQLDAMASEPLTRTATTLLPDAQGGYLLIHQGMVLSCG